MITQPAIPIGANCLVMLQSAKSVSYWSLFTFLVGTLSVLMVTQIVVGGFCPTNWGAANSPSPNPWLGNDPQSPKGTLT